MKQKLIIVIVILLAAYAACRLTALAQDKSPALTDPERQQWSQFAQIEKARTDALTQAVNDLLNTQPGPDSITVHARYQSAWLALQLAQSQRREWLGKVQGKYKCEGCAVSADGKKLEPPKA